MSPDDAPLTPLGELDVLGGNVAKLLIEAQRLNEGPMRCRELSLAITKLEECIHWIQAKLLFDLGLKREVFVKGERQ